MKTIKKIIAVAAIAAVAIFALSTTYVRAESENEHESGGGFATVESAHSGEKESEKSSSRTKTRSKKSKRKTKKHSAASGKPAAVPVAVTTGVASGSSYSMADVAAANIKTKCWTAIGGNVYDLTSWITQHPGGQGAILSLCGKDGTAAFNAQHGGQARPEQELKSLLIGTLK